MRACSSRANTVLVALRARPTSSRYGVDFLTASQRTVAELAACWLATRRVTVLVETVINVRAAKTGLKIVEVPSHEQMRIHGLSNLNAWLDGRRVLKTIMRERLRRLSAPNNNWRPIFDEVVPDARRWVSDRWRAMS